MSSRIADASSSLISDQTTCGFSKSLPGRSHRLALARCVSAAIVLRGPGRCRDLSQVRIRLSAGGKWIRTVGPTGSGSLCGERDGNNGSSTGPARDCRSAYRDIRLTCRDRRFDIPTARSPRRAATSATGPVRIGEAPADAVPGRLLPLRGQASSPG